jgi:fermentation-respiration switch protein FrsA (DUF1100 family)
MRYELPSHKYIKQVKCPITMFHGTEDKVIPLESAEKLYRSLSNDKVTFTVIEGGNHNDLVNFEAYHRIMDEVLK